jgi:catechol 2,3-dioxygenase-like lactoylglutathione lyase family enzyme
VSRTQPARIQLALNVDDVDAAVTFYSAMFGAEPAKRRPGYANFAIAEPPLKLVLLENKGQGGSLNHLGVELGSVDEVSAAQDRLAAAGLTEQRAESGTCCYAAQEKFWVNAPDGEPWEHYTVLADSPTFSGEPTSAGVTEGTCCGATAASETDQTPATAAACC